MNGRSQTITTRTKVYDAADGRGPCSEFFVGCNPDSANGVDVEIPGLHRSGEPFPLYPDSGITFKNNESINEVWLTPVGGDAIVDFGVVSMNDQA